MNDKSFYCYKIADLQEKIRKYEKILSDNDLFDKEVLEENEYDDYIYKINSEYHTILKRPNGEYYTKITTDKPDSYFYHKGFDTDYKGGHYHCLGGMYNQYDHKVMDQYIQYSFRL